MTAPVGVLAIGVGERLTRLLELLLERHGERVELLGLCDEAPAALERARRRFGERLPAFGDHRELLAALGDREPRSWVWIGSRNDRHRDHCADAFAAGLDVFCEKPLASTPEGCADIVRAARETGRRFATGFVLRHAPLVRRVEELVRQGTLGRPVSFEANEHLAADHGAYIMRNWRRFRRFSGPFLLEKCCHDVDLLGWMLGPIERVASFGGRGVFVPENAPAAERLRRPDDRPPLFEAWRSWEEIDPFTSEKDVVDHQVALLETGGGVRGTFTLNACSALPERRLAITGVEGALVADLVSGRLVHRRIGRSTERIEESFPAPDLHGGADGLIVDDLVAAMIDRREPAAALDAAAESAAVCFAIDDALRTGTVVEVAQVRERIAGERALGPAR